MIVPTVNKEIRSQLLQAACRTDLRAVHMQYTMVELVNEILSHPRMQECVRRGTDVIALLGYALQELSLCRRQFGGANHRQIVWR